MGIIGFIVAGLIIGAIARLLRPGRQNLGWGATLLIGLAGVMVFALSGHVVWWAAAVLSVTSLLGGLLGVSLARLLSSQGLRWTVVSYSILSVAIMVYTLVR